MKILQMTLIQFVVATLLCPTVVIAGDLLPITVDGKERVFYQAAPLSNPKGGDQFRGSDFIHPLKTPSGFVVTDIQPDDHLHHFGVWWPWKFIETGGRRVLCWELQEGDGLIQTRESRATPNGIIATSDYIDRRAPDGPVALLRETAKISVSDVITEPASGYFLDLEIIHRTVGDDPVVVSAYRYSGFSMRGPASWSKTNSTILTSEGMERGTANFTRAKWVRVEGEAGHGNTAGVVLMSHPDNHAHPEKLRTWDQQHDGAIFINFNPVMDEPWKFDPGKAYTRNYRLFVYDGSVSAPEVEELWSAYASTTRAR